MADGDKIIVPEAAQPSILKEEPPTTLDEVRSPLFAGYGRKPVLEARAEFSEKFKALIKQEMGKHPIAQQYNVIVLYDTTSLIKPDSDSIYEAIKSFEKDPKPLLLILVSNGGEPGTAYLIGKVCREFSAGKFIVVVPRHAKSAATLLACAAEEIHMGSMSELGPIDPQIDGMPALGLKNSIEHIVDLVARTPDSSKMFARYLKLSVPPIQIGYYERVAESAVQYAERLLSSHKATLANTPQEISTRLVKEYKDHGFVIDKEEATSIFGTDTIKCGTPEYAFGNAMYDILSDLEHAADFLGYHFYLIGRLDGSPTLLRRRT